MKRIHFVFAAALASALLLAACDDGEGVGTVPDAPDTTDSTRTASPTITAEPAETGTPDGTATEPASPTATPETVQSSISGGELEDLELTVGSTVVWTNEDDEPHAITSLTSTGEEIDSGEIEPGDTFEHTFEEVGVWDLVVDDGTDVWVVTVE